MNLPRKYFFALLLIILAAGVLLLRQNLRDVDRAMRGNFLNQATRVAGSLNIHLIRNLKGDESDLSSPAYQRLKSNLMHIREAHAGCRFIYLMGRRSNGEKFFYVDSESPDSEDYSPPGDIFEDASEVEELLFTGGRPVVTEPAADRWGVWVTAYIPIRDPRTFEIIALLGMDIDAADWYRTMWQATVPTFVFIGVLCGLFIIFVLFHNIRKDAISTGWQVYLESIFVVALGVVITGYVMHFTGQRELRARNNSFELLAHSETEHVANRIQHLRDAGLNSLARFVEASETITREEFNHFADVLHVDPAVHTWAWIPKVEASSRAAHVAREREEGFDIEDIWELDETGNRRPAADRPVHYPVSYIMPLEGNHAAVGYDQFSEPNRRHALSEALRTGLPTGTRPIPLVHLSESFPGMLIYQPVRNGSGVAVLVINTEGILPSVHSATAVKHDLIVTGEQLPESVRTRRPYSVRSHELIVYRPFAAFDHVFWIVARPGSEFDMSGPRLMMLWTAGTGAFLTLATALLVGIPIHRRRALHALVEERTRALKKSELIYRLLTESMKDVVWCMDVASNGYAYLSPSVTRLLGYTQDELLGGPVTRTIPQESIDRIRQQWTERLEAWKAGVYSPDHYFVDELAQQRKDGELVWTEVVSHFVTSAVTGRLELQGVTRDISERKQTTDALQENKRFLSDLIENSGTLIYVKSRSGIYQMVNHRWELVTGFERDQVLGRTDHELFPTETARRFRELDENVMSDNCMIEREETLESSDGLRHFISVKFPLYDAAGHVSGLCGMSTEITEQKKVGDRVRQQMNELRRWHDITLGREQRVLELKKEVNELLARLGEAVRYENT